MLLSFRVSNFLSIRGEQEFSFLHSAVPSRPRPEGEGEWDDSVGTLAGIFGANAAGKSNVLKALSFMREAVTASYPGWATKDTIPITPFVLDPDALDEPSLFEVVFQVDGARYQYGFQLTRTAVQREWLYAYPTHRRQVWFERDEFSAEPWHFGKSFTGRNKVLADLTKPTALFLSVAAANNHKMAMMIERIFKGLLYFVWPSGRDKQSFYTRSLAKQEGRRSEVVQMLRFADLGITDLRERQEFQDDAFRRRAIRTIKAAMDDDSKLDEKIIEMFLDSAPDMVDLGHSVGSSGETIYLPFETESFGTQAWFALIGPILRAIHSGGILAVDEIDASLHPHLTAEILRIFREPATNPKQAQLLFTSHDTALLGGLLGDRELTRDQVWFTEKKADGATVLYPLTDFSPRKMENLERGYLQGRYGAVPYIDRRQIDGLVKDSSVLANQDVDLVEGESVDLGGDELQ